jgi:chromodomain-helicase-DNA-binding protein 1
MNAAVPAAPSPPSGSDLSDTNEPIVNGASSDEDAPGEEYDEDVPMADETDSSSDVDAEGEPDGDYDSESPPPEQAAHSRAHSSTSQESQGTKRKASNDDDYLRDPQLYGLRRSVRGLKYMEAFR